MIGAVAGTGISHVVRLVTGFTGRQRTQSERCEQPLLDRVDDTACAWPFDERGGQAADREDLIGTKQRVDFACDMIAVDYVMKAAASFVPETPHERLDGAAVKRFPTIVDCACELERVEPQRLDFHRLPDARGHHPVADFRVHPGQLDAWFTDRGRSVSVAMN